MDDLNQRLRRANGRIAAPEPAFDRLLDRRGRKRRNSRIASLIVAFMVVGAGLAGAAIAFTSHGASPRHGFGSGGSEGAPLVAGTGQYYYWKTVRPMQGGDVVEELWWGEDGSGRYKVDQANPGYGVPNGMTWGPDRFPGVFPFETDLSGLSTDPEQLGGQLAARSAPTGASPRPQVTLAPGTSLESSELWSAATQILQMGNAGPRLRVALYHVLSQIPEVSAGSATDPGGRPATTLTLQFGDYYGGKAQTLYFDPDTHLLMAMTGGQDGTIVVADDGIVNSTSGTPTACDRFFPPAHA